MMMCDAEGVPNIVQKLEYYFGNFIFKVTYFDGRQFWMEPADEVNIMDRHLTEVQRLACERQAEEMWKPKC